MYKYISGFLLVYASGFFTCYVIYTTSYFSKEFDYNEDGKPDEVYEKKNAYINLMKSDRNFDGQFDQLSEFLVSGEIIESRSDDDFDGVYETKTTYVNNQPTASRVDTDGDGETDLVWFYEHGVLSHSLIFDPSTGLKTVRTEYSLGKAIKSKVDVTGDGRFDEICTYDFFENRHCSNINSESPNAE